MKRFTFCMLSLLMFGNLTADYHDDSYSCCAHSPIQKTILLKHVEGKGLGYSEGYTSLEGFFTDVDFLNEGCWMPFVDVRGHIFNNGKPAANAGVGVRYINDRIWGVNTYYDYRKTSHKNYNQMSFGLESLGCLWDFRLNGYFPIGNTHSSLFERDVEGFKGHHLILSGHREFAMRNINAEVGAHILESCYGSIYLAAGPYYLNGEGRNAWGGEGRLVADFANYLNLSLNVTYDRIFKGTVQGEISLIIPFWSNCDTELGLGYCGCMKDRAFQRVDRNEIIIVDKKKERKTAIDPRTKKPYQFVFVDNRSHSNGTIESPYPTLIDAQNNSQPGDIIYVFAGDGTSKGMNAGITLQNNQKLWGAGITHDLKTTQGAVSIPVMQEGLPVITNASGNAITCANNNDIAGIHVIANSIVHGISLNNITNACIHQNLIDVIGSTSTPPTSIGIFCNGSGGKIEIENNTFNQTNGVSVALSLLTVAPESKYFIQHNQFDATLGAGAAGILFGKGITNQTIGNFDTIDISHNVFVGQGSSGIGGVGIAIGGFGFSGKGHLILKENTFDQQTVSGPLATVLIQLNTGADLFAEVEKNVWKNTINPTQRYSFVAGTFESSTATPPVSICLKLHDNESDNVAGAYHLINTTGGTFIADIENNFGRLVETGVISPGTCPTGSQE